MSGVGLRAPGIFSVPGCASRYIIAGMTASPKKKKKHYSCKRVLPSTSLFLFCVWAFDIGNKHTLPSLHAGLLLLVP